MDSSHGVSAALATLHGQAAACLPGQRAAAQQFLVDFQRHPESWKTSINVLSITDRAPPLTELIFHAQTLRARLCSNPLGIAKEHLATLREQLFVLVCCILTGIPQHFYLEPVRCRRP